MNRILERITFMVIGALIASITYLVGNADRGAEAQEGVVRVKQITRFDRIEVSEIVLKNENGEIFLGFKKDDTAEGDLVPTIELGAKGDDLSGGGRIILRVEDNAAKVRVTTVVPPFENMLSEGIRLLTTGSIRQADIPATAAIKVGDNILSFEQTKK
ncbi:MAG: hypothetical protein OXN25_11010 [Candidatus Poribacteria bacterium]|nr:hypothetical protein [Candidatus Poribacteria bacterium]